MGLRDILDAGLSTGEMRELLRRSSNMCPDEEGRESDISSSPKRSAESAWLF